MQTTIDCETVLPESLASDLFEPFEAGIYMLNHSVGRCPKNTAQIIQDHYLTPWQQLGTELWPTWLSHVEEFRRNIAGLLKVDWQDVCPQTNLSSALSKLLPALPRTPGRDVIVYSEQDFPSIGFVLQKAQRDGFKLRCITADHDPLDLQTWQDHLGNDCVCALITHVHSSTSMRVDVAGICALARQSDIVSIVDIAQSAGVVPIDVNDWQADFVLGSAVKWLCGGPGAGFLWANPALVTQCQPVDVGWFSHEDPFEFDIHHFRYADGVLRFWGGTPSVLPYLVAANSIKIIDEIGPEAIHAHNQILNQRIINHLPESVVITPQDTQNRGGTLVLNFAGQQSSVMEKLAQEKIQFDARPTGLRLSPHVYNTTEEIDEVIACLNV
ncbi:aminotransferase class V-fold PLP-dependent enzyme [Halieaceae bacterium IMCC14734]|uniref:Aminotransferase class V-fold PLP-dependent enzyme n=2 Tax=Candidatus Litorirhabdus singularis TaxID=2518993 RepID=A0ABT3TL64_9GAMM|nr:aminotransferase class V-fold PLP-dependent enzyme [Candidatus Litorirhabdus singularis]